MNNENDHKMDIRWNTLDELSDDIIGNILLYCDFESAVALTKSTPILSLSDRPCLRFQNKSDWDHVWKSIYQRHRFCLPEVESQHSVTDYLKLCKEHRALLTNLVYPLVQSKRNTIPLYDSFYSRSSKRRQLPFGFPNRYFYFLPLIPNMTNVEEELDLLDPVLDPPPVFFECDSFVLTNPGTSAELLLLDPFDQSLHVIKNCLQLYTNNNNYYNNNNQCSNLVPNRRNEEEYWMEDHIHRSIMNTNTRSSRLEKNKMWSSRNCYENDEEMTVLQQEDTFTPKMANRPQTPTTTTTQDQSVSSQSSSQSPYQCLMRGSDNMHLDISHYFPNRNPALSIANEEYHLLCMGVDAKPIWKPAGGLNDNNINNNNNNKQRQPHWEICGTMVSLGRTISRETYSSEEGVCTTEIIVWTRLTCDAEYGQRKVCRLPWEFALVDVDPQQERIFVSYARNDGPDRTSNRIYTYPLVDWLQDKQETMDAVMEGSDIPAESNVSSTSYFPEATQVLSCHDPVVSFILDALGEILLVATCKKQHRQDDYQTLQIWNISTPQAVCMEILDVEKSIQQSVSTYLQRTDSQTPRINDRGIRNSSYRNRPWREDSNSASTSVPKSNHVSQIRKTFWLQSTFMTDNTALPPLKRMIVPKHLPLNKSGFFTLHYNRAMGSCLLFWQRRSSVGTFSWQVVSIINLDFLSRRRMPCVHYDGNRLIVFGQDNIGAVILVYQLANADFPNQYLGNESAMTKLSDDIEPRNGEELPAWKNSVYNLLHPSSSSVNEDDNCSTPIRAARQIRHVALGDDSDDNNYYIDEGENELMAAAGRLGMGGGDNGDFMDCMQLSCNERFIIVNTQRGNQLGSSPFSEGLLVIDLEDDRHNSSNIF